MDKRFDEFFKDIIRHEGGYSNHPNDSGGETKYGISKRAYPHLDIKNLTPEQAKVIYYYDYWVKGHFDKVAKISFQIATKVCDIAINCGIKPAHRMLFKALDMLNYKNIVSIGEDCLIALKDVVDKGIKDVFINNVISLQKEYYIGIVNKHPKNKVFLEGWLKRAEYKGVVKYG
ncbi:MAG: glycosyl hydrolase 108 family protein [Brevinematia bacterium]